MNEPDNDQLMKVMVRLKCAVGNVEPLVKKCNSGGNSPKKNFARANHACSDNGKKKLLFFYFLLPRSILSVNVMPSSL